MSLLSILRFITNHPLNRQRKFSAFLRFLSWQISSRLIPYPVIYPFGEKSKLVVKRGLTGATGNIYCGLHEFEDMAFVLHCLRDIDLFVDIGANIGTYTILAASEVGAKTISIEPVPSTFGILKSNIEINKLNELVEAFNVAIGSESSIIKFTKSFDTTNHVATKEDTDTIDVNVEKLDTLLSLDRFTVVKIDVEGFETEVLKGMSLALQNDYLKAIIIELNGSGSRYGYDEVEVHHLLLSLNYTPFQYNPFQRKLKVIHNYRSHNTIYIRDIETVNNRLTNARNYVINHEVF